MQTLTQISKELQLFNPPYECDKEFARHSYLSYKYDEIMLPYKNREIYILEIGVHKGGSLLLWQKYFDKAIIHGMDVLDARCEESKIIDRTEFILKDAYYPSTVNLIPDQYYDIIIEDGSHFIDHQVFVITSYAEKLKENGMLIVEDINGQDNLIECYKAACYQDYKTIEIYDNRKKTGIYDECMIVCRK